MKSRLIQPLAFVFLFGCGPSEDGSKLNKTDTFYSSQRSDSLIRTELSAKYKDIVAIGYLIGDRKYTIDFQTESEEKYYLLKLPELYDIFLKDSLVYAGYFLDSGNLSYTFTLKIDTTRFSIDTLKKHTMPSFVVAKANFVKWKDIKLSSEDEGAQSDETENEEGVVLMGTLVEFINY